MTARHRASLDTCDVDLERLFAGTAAGGHGGVPEVAVFAECDTSNLGDRAIHREVVRFFSECGWRASSYGLGSLAPAKLQEGNGPASFAPQRAADAVRRLPAVKRPLREIRQRYRMLRLLRPLSRVQLISVGGGALLTDINLHFPQSLAVLAESARLLNKPLLCLGCSAEGAWSARGEEKIRKFLDACTVVTARDQATARRVAAVVGRPVPVFGDFCLTETQMLNAGCRDHPREALALNVCQHLGAWGAQQQRYEDALIAVANELARRPVGRGQRTIRVFTTGLPDDAPAARRVFARFGGHGAELHLPATLEQLESMLATSALVIASRLHGAVLALAAGAATVGFSPAPKVRNFLSTMGLDQYCFGVYDGAWLTRRVGDAEHETLVREEYRMLARAPMWLTRAQLRAALQSASRHRAPLDSVPE
jgi:polysaccharide pyruvyl transferase WcaK-like protein